MLGSSIIGGLLRCSDRAPRRRRRLAAAWSKNWVKSSWKKSDGTAGDWTWTAGKWYGDAEADKGIQTGPDARFFAIAAPFAKPVDTTGKTLVLQARRGAAQRRAGAPRLAGTS